MSDTGVLELPKPTRVGFYVCFSFYLIGLIGASSYGFLVSRRNSAKGVSEVSSHFQGNRSFGSVVLFFTIVSSAFSGYTILGVPAESASVAFLSTRWLVGNIFAGLQFSFFGPRLRRLSVARNYMSPTDIIADRFNSIALKFATAVFLCIPQLIYVAVQFFSLKSAVHIVSGGEMDGTTTMWFLAALTIACEWLGGLRGVVLTDCIQGGLMLAGSICIPMILYHHYGGLSDLVGGNCPNYDPGTNSGCIANTKWYLTLHPTAFGASELVEAAALEQADPAYAQAQAVDASPTYNHTGLNMLNFYMLYLSFGLNPHMVQRYQAARKDSDLKFALLVSYFAPFMITLPAIYLGIVKLALFPKVQIHGVCDDSAGAPCNVFGVMLTDLMNKGVFPHIVAVVSACSAIAAIMSTADSCVMGASNVISLDVIRGTFFPNLSEHRTVWASKAVSACYVITAAAWSNSEAWTKEPGFYGKMLNLQNGFIWQCVPAFSAALYLSDRAASAYPILAGMLTGVGAVLALEQQVQQGADLHMSSGVIGLAMNVLVAGTLQHLLLRSARHHWAVADDERTTVDAISPDMRRKFGPQGLCHSTVASLMCGTTEPVVHRVGQGLLAGAVVLGVLSGPWYGRPYEHASEALAFSQFPMKEDGSCHEAFPNLLDFGPHGNATEGVCYPEPELGYVGGIPSFAARAVVVSVFGAVLLAVTTLLFWKTTAEEEEDGDPLDDDDDDEFAAATADPSDVMLTPYSESKRDKMDKVLLDNVAL